MKSGLNTELIKYKLEKDGFKTQSYKLIRSLLTDFFYSWNDFMIELKKRHLPRSIIKEINGFKMFLDLKNDKGLSRDLYYYGKREIFLTNYLLTSNILKKGDAVLDIGANIGYYALLESRLVGENGRVYAIEPVSSSYENLIKNIELNNIKNIDCYNLGAGSYSGKALINVSKKRNWSSLIDRTGMHFFKKEEIEIVRMDDFLKGKKIPNLVRMDVEGYEYAILDGMQEVLGTKDLKLLIEIHPDIMTEKQVQNMFVLLKNNGFKNAVIIFELSRGWLNQKDKVRPIVKWLTEKIGDTERLGEIKETDMDSVEKFLLKERKSTQVFFYN
ncbi:FkbM family methyltransferase [Candidatus Aerophobetes bacterium]|nr:FkbM family methyltransferase [Candidatus Aerophobetes bacterium]